MSRIKNNSKLCSYPPMYQDSYPWMWRCGAVVITTAQLHSAKLKLRYCAGSNPARSVLEIRDGEDLSQWSWLEIRLNAFCRSTIPQIKKNNSSCIRTYRVKLYSKFLEWWWLKPIVVFLVIYWVDCYQKALHKPLNQKICRTDALKILVFLSYGVQIFYN